MTHHPKRGKLLAVEGIDGAGKTTQVRRLEDVLRTADVPFISTKEPTTGPWEQRIRNSAQVGRMPPEEELAAFVNDRREHVDTVIEPALAEGKVVLVDRYYLSTVAYQGARGLSPERLLRENEFAPAPDILVILDVEPAIGLRRIRQRGDRADLFEREDELRKARQIFKNLTVPNLYLLEGTEPPSRLASHIARLLFDALSIPVPTDPSAHEALTHTPPD